MLKIDETEDTGGYYCHPEFSEFIGDSERVLQKEIDAWAIEQGIELKHFQDEMPEEWEGDEFYQWKPEPPKGYLTLSRWDNDDGEICAIFYRNLG